MNGARQLISLAAILGLAFTFSAMGRNLIRRYKDWYDRSFWDISVGPFLRMYGGDATRARATSDLIQRWVIRGILLMVAIAMWV